MNELPLLADFYDKEIVSVGIQDKGTLHRCNGITYEGVTHWLIALIWCESDIKSGWKVSVYPICPERPFWYLSPFFETTSVQSFDLAFKISQVLVSHSEQDVLTKRLFLNEMNDLSSLQKGISP